MRTVPLWSDATPTGPPSGGEGKPVVWDAAFRVDGSLLVVAVGKTLVVYNPNDGTKIKSRVAHGKDIYTLSTSRDGNFIASGSADKAVSVWNWDLSQKYTFEHAASVQALAFNPITPNLLATASAVDFAIWTMPSNSLKKIKVPSRVCCAAWTSDGQFLTLGLHNGTISMRDQGGVEKLTIKRSAPVWDLSWAPTKSGDGGGGAGAGASWVDTLSVACWDGTLSFYGVDGKAIGKERVAPGGQGTDPTSIRPFFNQEYLLVAGSDGKTSLATRDGIKLNTLVEGKAWTWRALPKPRSTSFVTVSNEGTVAMHNLVFSTVHGLYGDRYASRESCTDVLVRHLVSDARVRIKCRDYVKKVAVYRDRLAVQLSDRIIIYETVPLAEEASAPAPPSTPITTTSLSSFVAGGVSSPGGTSETGRVRGPKELQAVTERQQQQPSGGGSLPLSSRGGPREAASASAASTMMYRLKDRILQTLECNLLVVTHAHIVLCQDNKLSMYNFGGVKEREWVLEAVIRYIKVVGGPPKGEGLLVGLKSGAVFRVFLNNPFPVPLVHHKSAIRCLDISMSRTRLALVDEQSSLYVYDCASGEPVWSESNAASVAWNAEFEDMLCFSGGGMLSIKTGTFPIHQQKLPGYVVGFTGSKVFALQSTSTVKVEVPHGAALRAYIEAGEWESAYRVACLGVTPEDWRSLGLACLGALQLGVARAAFLRSQPVDMRYIELINHFEGVIRSREGGGGGGAGGGSLEDSPHRHSLVAEVLAYGGRYSEAAKEHLKAGTVEKALEMFMDLKLWKEARKFAEEVGSGRVDVTSLMLKQAQWCEDSGDVGAAATIYAGLGQAARAVSLLAERALWGPLMELVRSLPSSPPSAFLFQEGGSGLGSAAAAAGVGAAGMGGRGRSDSMDSTGSTGVDGDELAAATAGVGGGGGGGGVDIGGLSKDVKKALGDAGSYLTRGGLIPFAREVFGKLGDVGALVQLHIDAGEWALAHKLAGDTEAAVLAAAAAEQATSHTPSTILLPPTGTGAGAGAAGAAPPSSSSSTTPPALSPRTARNLVAARNLVSHVHLCRGEALAGRDKFEEALKAYEAGGRPDLTAKILSELAGAALEEGRFSDASLHYQRLSKEAWVSLERACSSSSSSSGGGGGKSGKSGTPAAGGASGGSGGGGGMERIAVAAARYRRFSHYADLYAAYDVIYTATAMPFTTAPPLTVFNAARYLLNAVCGSVWGDVSSGGGGGGGRGGHSSTTSSSSSSASSLLATGTVAGGGSTVALGRLPHRLSLTRVLYALAKQSLVLGAFTTARRAIELLTSDSLLIPMKWRDSIDVMSLNAATSPPNDAPELTTTCPRCKALQPPLAANVLASVMGATPANPPPSASSSSSSSSQAMIAYGGVGGRRGGGGGGGGGDAPPPGGSPTTSQHPSPPPTFLADVPLTTFMTHWLCAVSGDSCTTCCAPFIRSSLTYEVLPLVEFAPAPGIDLPTALNLLAEEAPVEVSGAAAASFSSSKASSSQHQESLTFTSGGGGGKVGGGGVGSGVALFQALCSSSGESAGEKRVMGGAFGGARGYTTPTSIVTVPANVLKAMRPSDVLVVRAPAIGGPGSSGIKGGSGSILQLCASGTLTPTLAEEKEAPPRFYFNTAANTMDIAVSAACGRMFHMEDLELAVLSSGVCPFSRAPAAMVGI